MNKREVKREGRYVGKAYVNWIEIGKYESEDGYVGVWLKGVQCDNCNEIHHHPVDWLVCVAMGAESNGRQYAEDFSYEIAKEPNSEDLFDAYEEGIYFGALAEARSVFKNLFTRKEQKLLNNGNLKAHGLTFVVNA